MCKRLYARRDPRQINTAQPKLGIFSWYQQAPHDGTGCDPSEPETALRAVQAKQPGDPHQHKLPKYGAQGCDPSGPETARAR